jgi:hypothetical protein
VPELIRKPVSEEVEPSNLILALALKAEAVLGYSWLRERLRIELGSLASTLDELAIEPFRMEDVNRYKEEKAHMVEQQVLGEYKERARCSGDGEFPPGTYVRAIWHRVPLRGYNGEVPGFALSHAMDIKERMPTAEFEVEELRVDKRYDPFLVVSCRRERFYIDGWDERGFETQHS